LESASKNEIPEKPEPMAGDVFDGYQIERTININDMSATFVGKQEHLQIPRIIKVCRRTSSKAYRRAFILKRNLHARIVHDAIAPVISGGSWDEGLPVSYREYCKGSTLESYILTHGELPFIFGLALFVTVCDVLGTFYPFLQL